jgi:hypothetical protein
MICTPFDQVINGERVSGFICSSGRRQRCMVCRKNWATKLCDGPAPAGSRKKTCDLPMCSQCAKSVGEDRDLCPKCSASGVPTQLPFDLEGT